MAKHYVTYDVLSSSNRIYESDKINECIRKAKEIVEKEDREIYVKTVGKLDFRCYKPKPFIPKRLKHPQLIKDENGRICADLKSQNKFRDTSARYCFEDNVLTIAGKIIEKHPKFKDINKFEHWVSHYFAEGKDAV